MTDETAERLRVALPAGTVDVSAAWGNPSGAWATLAVAHGAGAGYDHPFLVGFARGMRSLGVATLRFNFPYLEAGRRMPGPAAHAIGTWRAAMAFAADRAAGPLWAAGKSYGGRIASMAVAEGMDATGLVYLGYPLHPPGDPSKERVAHLPSIAVPQLFVEGTNDPFVDPHAPFERAVASCQDATIEWIDGGGHSFEVAGRKRPADRIGADLAPLVAAFVGERS